MRAPGELSGTRERRVRRLTGMGGGKGAEFVEEPGADLVVGLAGEASEVNISWEHAQFLDFATIVGVDPDVFEVGDVVERIGAGGEDVLNAAESEAQGGFF